MVKSVPHGMWDYMMTTNLQSPPAPIDPQSPAARRAKWFGWWFYLTVIVVAPFALILMAAVGVYVWWKLADAKAAADVKAEVARIQAAGEPVTIYDLYAWHRVPEGTTDTTPLWLTALTMVDAIPIAHTKYMDVPIVGGNSKEVETLAVDHPQTTLDLADEFLKVNDGTVQAVLAAANAEGECRLPVAFEAGARALISTQRARSVARVMSLRTRVAVAQGNSDAAVESIEANLALIRAIDHQPWVVDQLVRIAIISVAMSDIEQLLNNADLTEEQLARLQSNLQTLDIQNSFTHSLIGERGVGYHGFHQFPTPPPPGAPPATDPMAGGKLIRPADCQFFLELMQEYIDASRQPLPKSIDDSKQIAARVQSVAQSTNPLDRMRYVLSMQVVPATEAAIAASARAQALRNLNLAAIAAERYRLAHGEYPPDLKALGELLSAVPLDPYDGQPLRVVRKEGELVLYSIGQDGRDDGGQDPEDRNQPDIVVRLAKPPPTKP